MILYGSICLSDIPRDMMKKVVCKDGTTKVYVNLSVFELHEKSKYGDSHIISCSPKQEERKEGVNYIFGHLKTYEKEEPTTEEINRAPVVQDDDLPF